MNLQFDLSKISNHRAELMGIATILILVCHAPANIDGIGNPWSHILTYGSTGVDFFLFLSGIGIWFSLDKEPLALTTWYFRRYLRLLLPCIVVMLLLKRYQSPVEFISFLFGFDFWKNHNGFWFVDLLLLLYLVTPLFVRIKNITVRIVLLFLIAVLFYLFSVLYNGDNTVLLNIRDVSQNIQSYLVGLTIAPFVKSKVHVNLTYVFSLTLFFVICFVLINNIYHSDLYLGPVISFSIIILFCLLLEKQSKLIKKSLAFAGRVSLESYLYNVSLPTFLLSLHIFNGTSIGLIGYLAVIIIGVALSYLTNRLCGVLTKSIERIYDRSYKL